MSARENMKRLEYSNRKFEIQKMDALESLAVLKELLTRALPFDIMSIFGSEISQLMGSKQMGGIGSLLDSKKDMSIDEFILLQKRILKYSYEILPSGPVQIVTSAGDFGVMDVDKDLALILKLLVESVRLNYESFFIEMLQSIGIVEKAETSEVQS